MLSIPDEHCPATDAVTVEIVYFYRESSLDLDNVAKPILDALKGIAYMDDAQVTDVIVRKRGLFAGSRLRDPSPVLAGGFDLGGREFIYVIVDDAAREWMSR